MPTWSPVPCYSILQVPVLCRGRRKSYGESTRHDEDLKGRVQVMEAGQDAIMKLFSEMRDGLKA
jgi:hypothetical protein